MFIIIPLCILIVRFEDVIRVFENKEWLTGYHCVVFKDGSARVICRLDRLGNHAKPHNGHSLELHLMGTLKQRIDVKIQIGMVDLD